MAKHRLRWLWIIPGALVALVILVLLFLNPIVTYATQKGLDRLRAPSGTFKSLNVTLIHPGYDSTGSRSRCRPARSEPSPTPIASRCAGRGASSSTATWSGASRSGRRAWCADAAGRERQAGAAAARDRAGPGVGAVGGAGAALDVDSQLILVDEHHEGERLWIHDLELTLENMASRKKLMKGLPLLVTVRGKLQKTGELTVYS